MFDEYVVGLKIYLNIVFKKVDFVETTFLPKILVNFRGLIMSTYVIYGINLCFYTLTLNDLAKKQRLSLSFANVCCFQEIPRQNHHQRIYRNIIKH